MGTIAFIYDQLEMHRWQHFLVDFSIKSNGLRIDKIFLSCPIETLTIKIWFSTFHSIPVHNIHHVGNYHKLIVINKIWYRLTKRRPSMDIVRRNVYRWHGFMFIINFATNFKFYSIFLNIKIYCHQQNASKIDDGPSKLR